MKRILKPITEELIDKEYSLFIEYCNITVDGTLPKLYEGRFTTMLGDTIKFIKEISSTLGFKAREFFQMIKNRDVHRFFTEFRWNLKSILDLLKKGYDTYKKVMNFLPDLATELVVNSRAFQWTGEQVKKIQEFLKRHPMLMRISGIALAGLLLVIWMNMSFIGDIEFDMDFGAIFDSIAGRFTIEDFLLSRDGVKTIILLITGMMGISFRWWSTPVNIALALFQTIAKKLKIRFQKGKSSDDEIEALAT